MLTCLSVVSWEAGRVVRRGPRKVPISWVVVKEYCGGGKEGTEARGRGR